MKSAHFDGMVKLVKEKVPSDRQEELALSMKEEFLNLCNEVKDKPESFTPHLHNNIFPVVSAFRALMKLGFKRDEAAEIAMESFKVLMEKPAKALRTIAKIPGMYKRIPSLGVKMVEKSFTEDSGFRFKKYDVDKSQLKFDVTECPYLKTCRELDALDVSTVFCASDDICYGNIHPGLIWHRENTIARGSDHCDFNLYVKK